MDEFNSGFDLKKKIYIQCLDLIDNQKINCVFIFYFLNPFPFLIEAIIDFLFFSKSDGSYFEKKKLRIEF